MRILFLLLFFIHHCVGFSQQAFIEVGKIRASTISPSFKTTAIATDDKIYFLNNEEFRFVDSLAIDKVENRIVSDVFFIHSNMIAVRYGTVNPYLPDLLNPRLQFYEYPEDSIFLYNTATKSIFSKLSGNCFVSQSVGTKSLMGYNDYFEYTDNFENKNLGTRKGEIVLFDGEQKVQAPTNGPVIGQCISPLGDELTLLYYFYDSIGIEVRNTIDLSVQKTAMMFGAANELKYSDDGKYLIILNRKDRSNGESFRVFDAATLAELALDTYPLDLKTGSIENGKFWTIINNSIIEKEVLEGRITTEIWANLTKFSDLYSFYKLNENELVVIGKVQNYATGILAYGAQKLNLNDLKVYADKTFFDSAIDTSSMFNPAIPFVQNNTIVDGKKQFSSDGRVMLVTSTNQLQLWDVAKRMKIHDLYFDAEIQGYLSGNGEQVLIFKKAEGKSSGDFYLQLLTISTGELISKQYFDNPYPFVNNDYGNAVQSQNTADIWYFSNHLDNGLFMINTTDLSIETSRPADDLGQSDLHIDRRMMIPSKEELLLKVEYVNFKEDDIYANSPLFDVKRSGYYLLNANDRTYSKIEGISYHSMIEVLDNQHIVGIDTSNRSLFMFDLLTKKVIKKIDLPKDLNPYFCRLVPNGEQFFIASSERDSILLFSYDENLTQKSKVRLKGNYDEFYFVNGDFLVSEGLFEDKKWFTYLPTRNVKVPWFANEVESKISHSLAIHEKYLWLDDFQLIDLSTLTIKDVEKRKSFNQWQLLKSRNAFVRVMSEGGYSNEPSYFFIEARDFNNFDSVLWKSNRIKTGEYLPPSITFIDRDEKYGSIEESSFSATKREFIIDFDTHQLEKVSKGKLEISPTVQEHLAINFQNVEFEGKSYYARDYLSMATFNKERNVIIGIGSKLFFWTPGNSSPIKTIAFTGFYADQFVVDKNKLYLISRDRIMDVFDLDSYEKLLTIEVVGEDEQAQVVAYTPTGYFKSPKDAIRNLHFIKDGAAFPLLNYELFLNRPDLVLATLNFANARDLEVYKLAYQKRLERNGMTDIENVLSLNLPKVQLLNTIPAVSENSSLTLDLKFSSDAKFFTVFDNGVPVISNNVSENNLLKVKLELHSGLNSISVVAKSDKGLESDPVFASINCLEKSEPAKIYYIGVGVSSYKDSVWNLNYADADVRSLSAFLTNKNYFHSSVSVDTLVNAQATKQNYLALKNKLMETSVNDIVVISFSGHGLLDEGKNFYFATHDIDFQQPQDRGLSYDDIQSLMNDIPARKKLLLIDACHSGEADENGKSTWRTNNNQAAKEGQKGGGEVENLSDGNLEEESFELMKNSFQDLDRGNGTFVISAARAKDVAIEEGGNGVFTSSFINAIADWQWNSKGELKISALQKEVYERVLKETKGAQRPTSRSENIEWDWILE
ncbi:MAG: caspase family protein [Bacteroidota bacterium]